MPALVATTPPTVPAPAQLTMQVQSLLRNLPPTVLSKEEQTKQKKWQTSVPGQQSTQPPRDDDKIALMTVVNPQLPRSSRLPLCENLSLIVKPTKLSVGSVTLELKDAQLSAVSRERTDGETNSASTPGQSVIETTLRPRVHCTSTAFQGRAD